jgi:putative tricarboxylic transport membrane protein
VLRNVFRNSEIWGGLFWLALGLFIMWEGRDMGIGRTNEPGAGFAFFWIGLVMCGLAVAVISQSILSGGPDVGLLWADAHWGKVLIVVLLLVAYAFAFERIGFIVCTLALLLTIMWFVDPVRWWLALIVAVGATFGVWAVLTKVLKIQLPAGILEGIL